MIEYLIGIVVFVIWLVSTEIIYWKYFSIEEVRISGYYRSKIEAMFFGGLITFAISLVFLLIYKITTDILTMWEYIDKTLVLFIISLILLAILVLIINVKCRKILDRKKKRGKKKF